MYEFVEGQRYYWDTEGFYNNYKTTRRPRVGIDLHEEL